MIELIFVIVILGILAAVAIPKLAATRDDAAVAKSSMEVASAVHDFGSHYTAQGTFNFDSSEMTNVKLVQNGGGSGVMAPADTELWHYYVKDANCVDLNVTGDGNVSVIDGADAAVRICVMLKNGIEQLQNSSPHVYGGGAGINYD